MGVIDTVLDKIGKFEIRFYKPKLGDVVVFNKCLVGVVEKIYEKYPEVVLRIEHSYYPERVGETHNALISRCKLIWRKE